MLYENKIQQAWAEPSSARVELKKNKLSFYE